MRIALLTLIIMASPLISWGAGSLETTVNYYNSINRYVLVAYYEPRLFIDLRSLENDKILDDMVISSRYGTPSCEYKDVIHDDNQEILITTHDGGSGVTNDSLRIISIIEDKLVLVGQFAINYDEHVFGHSEVIKGNVSFPAKNRLVYSYKKKIVDGGKESSISRVENYAYDTKLKKYTEQKDAK